MSSMDPAEVRAMIGAAVELEVDARLREIMGRIAALEARVAGAAEPAENVVTVDDWVAPALGGGGAPMAAVPTTESAESSPGKDRGAIERSNRTLALEDIEEESTREWTYQLQGSIWDASLFIGVPVVGRGGSAFLTMGLLCNILLQMVFATVLAVSFGSVKALPTVEDAWEWRESHGHQFSNILTATRTSLVRAVCSGRAATMTTSTWQHDLYTMIRNYTTEEPLGFPLGALLCSAVLFSWALSICQEVNSLWAFAAAVLRLPRGSVTKIRRMGEGELLLASCTLRRKCCIMLIMFIRCWIAMALLIFGSIWLARTLSIVDLVLNAAALAFIIGMDELIFETLAPLPTRVLVRELRPLVRPRGIQWRGLTLGVTLNLVGALVALSCFFWGYVVPDLARTSDIQEAVCGGFKDFVITDTSLGMLIATETENPYVGQRQEKSFARQAVFEAVTLGGAGATQRVLELARFEGFMTMQQAPVAELVDLLANQVLSNKCGDYNFSDPDTLGTFRVMIQHTLGVDVETCAAAAGYCHGDVRLLRLVCPATCGCGDPFSGLYVSGQEQGCPRDLCLEADSYTSRLSAIPCVDHSVSELRGMPGWERIVTAWADMWSQIQSHLRRQFQEVAPILIADGCGGLDLIPARFKTILCTSNLQFGSVRPFCPSACGCASDFSRECPPQCSGGLP